MSFTIVIFTKDHSVEYISTKWLIGKDKCLWPAGSSSTVSRLRSNHTLPCDHGGEKWEEYSIQIIGVKSSYYFIINLLA